MDLLEMYGDSSGKDEEQRIAFCQKLLDELRKMKGEDLAPHLSSIVFHTETALTEVSFSF